MKVVSDSTGALSDKVKRQFSDWASATLEDLRVQKNSGLGGSTTFKMAIGDAGEAAVCVHMCSARRLPL
jgi:hypothetical protein